MHLAEVAIVATCTGGGAAQPGRAVSQPLPRTRSNAATTIAPTTMPAIAPPLKPILSKLEVQAWGLRQVDLQSVALTKVPCRVSERCKCCQGAQIAKNATWQYQSVAASSRNVRSLLHLLALKP